MDRRHRLRSSRDFSVVVRRGKRASSGPVAVSILRDAHAEPARVGFTARAANAVRRNRSKRLLREAFRPCIERLPAGADAVVAARADLSQMSLAEVRAAVGSAMTKAGVPC